ncbi:alpha/beta hydrolase family protein [Zavarzinella formosa]|uniref:alpha/beta hydrolase family protein n=1 Tax=Zavarzinella formosa TaxID=360055 RepID=UPI000302C25F|nr:alpha/beta fold hydrolase [Zavarzinella formosa]
MANYDDELARRAEEPTRRRRAASGQWGSTWLIVGLILGVVALASVGCCIGMVVFAKKNILPTEFPATNEDYAAARQKFKTTLDKKGPAPQAYDEVEPPDDVEEVTFESGDLTLRAWITAKPKEIAARQPAVLFLHGGFSFSMEDWEMARPFEEAGFVVMVPMLRGENGLPGDYSMFYDEVDDVLAAAAYLADQPHVDPKRIYVAGHSVGGTLAMLASMTSSRFKACASFSGSTDQPRWAKAKPEYVPFDPENAEEFRLRSPLAFPGSFKCPARLYYGNFGDDVLLKLGGDELARKAKKAGRDVVTEEVQGDHMSMTEAAIPMAIDFFNGPKK